jgi:prepilin peptidase CpaA
MSGPAILLGVMQLLLVVAAWTDFRSLRIPNGVTAAIVALFPFYAILSGMSIEAALLQHLSAGVAVLAVGILLFAAGKVGGGDVKLLAGVALWLGWADLAPGLLVIALVGSALCFALLGLRATPLPLWLELRGLHSVVLEKGKGAPYAIAIAAGFALFHLLPR